MLNGNNEKELKPKSTIGALKKHIRFYYSFKGRLNRKKFILLLIESFGIIAFLLCIFMLSSLFVKASQVFVTTISIAAMVIAGLVIGIATMGIAVRRLHDLNLSGLWVVLPLPFEATAQLQRVGIAVFPPTVDLIVTIIGSIIVIGLVIPLWFIKGTKGDNKYGPDLLLSGKS